MPQVGALPQGSPFPLWWKPTLRLFFRFMFFMLSWNYKPGRYSLPCLFQRFTPHPLITERTFEDDDHRSRLSTPFRDDYSVSAPLCRPNLPFSLEDQPLLRYSSGGPPPRPLGLATRYRTPHSFFFRPPLVFFNCFFSSTMNLVWQLSSHIYGRPMPQSAAVPREFFTFTAPPQ